MIRYIEGFSCFVTSTTAPIASGWSKIAGWDSPPLENAALARRTPSRDVPRQGDRGVRLLQIQCCLSGRRRHLADQVTVSGLGSFSAEADLTGR